MSVITMGENELYDHRLKTLEDDVKILYGKVNTFAVNQAETNLKLDNLLVSIGELKESITDIKRRPSLFWDKLIFAIIGAVGSGLGYAILSIMN